MIKINIKDQDLSHEIFELLRIYFPSREKEKDISANLEKNILTIELDNKKYKINIENLDKNKVKKEILLILKEKLENKINFGTLTGMRPTKKFLKLLENFDFNEAKKILKEDYLLSDEAIEMISMVGKNEMEILKEGKNKFSIYVHIPFCPSICKYCSFKTLVNKNNELIKNYVKFLIKEIKAFSNKKERPHSIYIGGGTPSAIGKENLKLILEVLKESFLEPYEFTVECGRPETIDDEILRTLKDFGVNRISINPQTMNDETLKNIGRNHTSQDIIKAYELTKNYNFIVNMDLIIGLPFESHEMIINSLNKVLELKPQNITIHTLALKRGSELMKEEFFEKNLNITFDEIGKIMLKNFYKPYYMYRQKRILMDGQNIGWTLGGFPSIYNVVMIEEKESILGFGMCASSKFLNFEEDRFEKFINFKDIKEYMTRIDEIIEKKKILQKNFL